MRTEFAKTHGTKYAKWHGEIHYRENGKHVRTEYDKSHPLHGHIHYFENGKYVRNEFAKTHPYHGKVHYFENGKHVRTEIRGEITYFENGRHVRTDYTEAHKNAARQTIESMLINTAKKEDVETKKQIEDQQQLIMKREERHRKELAIKEQRRLKHELEEANFKMRQQELGFQKVSKASKSVKRIMRYKGDKHDLVKDANIEQMHKHMQELLEKERQRIEQLKQRLEFVKLGDKIGRGV